MPGSGRSHTNAAKTFLLLISMEPTQRKLRRAPCPKFRRTARVAFNTEGDAKNRPGPERHIAIADVASGKVTVVPNIPSDNCFGPVWSPDGKQLAFSIMTDNAWHLGLVNTDGSGFRFVKNAELKPEAFGASEWARDGKSIFCHDLDNIYHIDLDGNVLKKWELAKILTDASMNGGDRMSISPDGKALLMDVDCGSEQS